MLIKPGITADGFRTAVRDYTEPVVVEELAANSYDADSSTVLVLLDSDQGYLHIIDDGIGFTEDSFSEIAILGAGDTRDIPYSKGKRHYLGSYGYGLKSTLNIATKVEINSLTTKEHFQATIDWNQLEDVLKSWFEGFPCSAKPTRSKGHGTWIKLSLKNPTTKAHLDKFGDVLSNLPTDGKPFQCYYGLYAEVADKICSRPDVFATLDSNAQRLSKKNLLVQVGVSTLADLKGCQTYTVTDKHDKTVTATIYFTGLQGEKVKPLKRGLRGIYVRIHGRILKHSFTDSKFTYNISRWKKFESGTRVELSVDWLRDQISLSRTGIRFADEKLEKDFTGVLSRCVSAFIQPQLQTISKKRARVADRRAKQRLELANKRIQPSKDIRIPGLKSGFVFKPETDGELALVIAQATILAKVLPQHRLIDYNDQAPFDCLLYDKGRRELVNTELEPSLPAFLEHNEADDIQLLITWTRARWRIGAKKKAKHGFLQLMADESKKPGRYKLLEYASDRSKTPRNDLKVLVLDEALKSG